MRLAARANEGGKRKETRSVDEEGCLLTNRRDGWLPYFRTHNNTNAGPDFDFEGVLSAASTAGAAEPTAWPRQTRFSVGGCRRRCSHG